MCFIVFFMALHFLENMHLYAHFVVFVRCGVLTVEIEHVDVATMEKLEQQGVDCQPKASTIRIIQVRMSFFILSVNGNAITQNLLSCQL